MATVGQRPRQFNPISKGRDNTDDLEAEEARVAARYARKSVTDFYGQTDPVTPKVVPPMPSRTRGNGNGGNENGNGGDNGD